MPAEAAETAAAMVEIRMRMTGLIFFWIESLKYTLYLYDSGNGGT